MIGLHSTEDQAKTYINLTLWLDWGYKTEKIVIITRCMQVISVKFSKALFAVVVLLSCYAGLVALRGGS